MHGHGPGPEARSQRGWATCLVGDGGWLNTGATELLIAVFETALRREKEDSKYIASGRSPEVEGHFLGRIFQRDKGKRLAPSDKNSDSKFVARNGRGSLQD
jgi:hypothetical protein